MIVAEGLYYSYDCNNGGEVKGVENGKGGRWGERWTPYTYKTISWKRIQIKRNFLSILILHAQVLFKNDGKEGERGQKFFPKDVNIFNLAPSTECSNESQMLHLSLGIKPFHFSNCSFPRVILRQRKIVPRPFSCMNFIYLELPPFHYSSIASVLWKKGKSLHSWKTNLTTTKSHIAKCPNLWLFCKSIYCWEGEKLENHKEWKTYRFRTIEWETTLGAMSSTLSKWRPFISLTPERLLQQLIMGAAWGAGRGEFR